MFCQWHDVLGAITQWRHRDRKNMEAIKQVFAQRAVRYCTFQVAIGCGDQANVAFLLGVRADTHESA